MAGQLNLKVFYVVLALIAVVGTVALWMVGKGAGSAPVEILDTPFSLDAVALPGYVIGSETAPVEIVEYVDFSCPACAMFTILEVPTIKERLVNTGMARLRFRGFALNPHSYVPQNAAACAGEQDMFWEMHDSLMFNQRDWMSNPDWPQSRRTKRLFRSYARDIGLNMNQYDSCVDENRYYDQITATRNEISEIGIQSTPTFDVGRFRVPSARMTYDSLRALVERSISEQQ